MKIRDGDLLLVGATSPGVILREIVESGAAPTVFFAGPAFERETALSVPEFAYRSDSDVLLPLPFGELRHTVRDGKAQYLPARISDYPRVMKRLASDADRTIGVVEVAVAADGEYTPGICGLGVEAICELSDHLVVEVNPEAPRLPGLSIPAEAVDREVEAKYGLVEMDSPDPGPRTAAAAENAAEIIPDGSTVQMGLGTLGEAVAMALKDHEDLGLHSGLVGPSVRDLIDSGVIVRGSAAANTHGAAPFERPALACLAVGDRTFYDWLETSEAVALGPIRKTHDPAQVGKNPAFVAINSALQVDLMGQINAERISGRQMSGPGGQPDFVRGAHRSDGGRAVIVLTSAVEGGPSKIVPGIAEDGTTTTPQDGPDFVVTEHGMADLRAATTEARRERLRRVADPVHRSELEETAPQE